MRKRIAHASCRDIIRDYVLIIDKSGSMAGSRWRDAKAAVEQIAPKVRHFPAIPKVLTYTQVVEADPDGVTMYFFNDKFVKYENVRTTADVKRIFDTERPGGTTGTWPHCHFDRHHLMRS